MPAATGARIAALLGIAEHRGNLGHPQTSRRQLPCHVSTDLIQQCFKRGAVIGEAPLQDARVQCHRAGDRDQCCPVHLHEAVNCFPHIVDQRHIVAALCQVVFSKRQSSSVAAANRAVQHADRKIEAIDG